MMMLVTSLLTNPQQSLGFVIMLCGSLWKLLVMAHVASPSPTTEIASSVAVALGVFLSIQFRTSSPGLDRKTPTGQRNVGEGNVRPRVRTDKPQQANNLPVRFDDNNSGARRVRFLGPQRGGGGGSASNKR